MTGGILSQEEQALLVDIVDLVVVLLRDGTDAVGEAESTGKVIEE